MTPSCFGFWGSPWAKIQAADHGQLRRGNKEACIQMKIVQRVGLLGVILAVAAGCSQETTAPTREYGSVSQDFEGNTLAGGGACCLPDGSCIPAAEIDCAAAEGEYQGDGTSCDPSPCEPVEETYEGCGLGFWKNQTEAWMETGYTEDTEVGSVFTIPAELDALADDTLHDALRYGGGAGAMGGAKLLLRKAVVALLNASHPDIDYGLEVSDISTLVDEALSSLDRREMIDTANEIGPRNGGPCPLD